MAPFLAIGGYIASGFYMDYQLEKERMLPLKTQGECQIMAGNCKLSNGKFLVTIADTEGHTQLTTTHPVDSAIISLVPSETDERLFPMEKAENPLNWTADTDLATIFQNDISSLKLRLVITIKNTTYLGEFITSNQ